MAYLSYPLGYQRLKTTVVRIGHLAIGGDHPILVQSMLTSPTHDVDACINEIRVLYESGCELIRLTVPSRKDLDQVPEIRRIMLEEGLKPALVADIHFSPKLSVESCEFFEKIRINPGNFSDLSKSAGRTEQNETFEEGRERLAEALRPLAQNLKKHNRALRIGVNQGSLSNRMIERFGDTPVGMVASALESVQLLEASGFDQTVISLKSSNPLVVQKAYRLLVEKQSEKTLVPVHLGVTEAGNGLMARIKSLVGIGALMRDGIGDTIRVSLAEPSDNEIVFAEKLVELVELFEKNSLSETAIWRRSLDHRKVGTRPYKLTDSVRVGGESGFKLGKSLNQPLPSTEMDFETDFEYQRDGDTWRISGNNQIIDYVKTCSELAELDKPERPVVVGSQSPLYDLRKYYSSLDSRTLPPAVGLRFPWKEAAVDLADEIELASMLSEGLIDFLLISESISGEQLVRLLLLLQAVRVKMVTTDYIICPSCGRTLFDLQIVSEKIKKATAHLKGLKIGIMGCIVNGPGEMADADFGYVGSGPGKVDLYYGQTRVKRGIDQNKAVDELLSLIKEKKG